MLFWDHLNVFADRQRDQESRSVAGTRRPRQEVDTLTIDNTTVTTVTLTTFTTDTVTTATTVDTLTIDTSNSRNSSNIK